MAELEQRLLNKEMITELFTDEWREEVFYDYREKVVQLRNKMEIKIRGVKEKVRVKVYFQEVIPNGLAVVDWEVRWSSVKIGDGRLAALHEELINILNQEEYYLPYWVEENKYTAAIHLKTRSYYRNKHECNTYKLEREVEPELLLEAFADLARQNDSLEKTQLVFHNGKVYSRVLEDNKTLLTEEDI